jgi:hypothetical protein
VYSSDKIKKVKCGMVETKDGTPEGLKRGKRVVAYLSAEVMADLERVAQHYSLSKSEVIAEAVKEMGAQLCAKEFPLERFG